MSHFDGKPDEDEISEEPGPSGNYRPNIYYVHKDFFQIVAFHKTEIDQNIYFQNILTFTTVLNSCTTAKF